MKKSAITNAENYTMKKTILIVEDFDYIRNLTGRYFEMNGYQVISAGNLHEASAIGAHEKPKLIIADFDISNDPYVIAALLHSILPESRIVMIDGRAGNCNEEAAAKAGVSAVLARSFSPAILEDVLHAGKVHAHA